MENPWHVVRKQAACVTDRGTFPDFSGGAAMPIVLAKKLLQRSLENEFVRVPLDEHDFTRYAARQRSKPRLIAGNQSMFPQIVEYLGLAHFPARSNVICTNV